MTSSTADTVRRTGIKLAALAQDGLTYASNDYDIDRYRQVGRLAVELLSALSGRSADELAVELGRDSGYATPKIDVRGVIFDEQERVLLMREKADGRWSLPGGWADPGDSPSAGVVREIRGPRITVQPATAACARVQVVLPVPHRRARAASRSAGAPGRGMVLPW
ncbi:MAG: NUDIX hydrolase N-terminal domain-containing protein [Mycobacterium sp.]|nr:NUDIX hydrolase N-terminal domain-containing protein [Mycobacterium sp.]